MHTLIGLHSLWRWVVLLVVVIALVRGVIGWLRGGAWTSNDRILTLVAVSALDIQLILGLLTYGGTKSWNASAFIAYIHPLVMIAAIVIAHITSSRVRKTTDAQGKFRTLAIGLLVAI